MVNYGMVILLSFKNRLKNVLEKVQRRFTNEESYSAANLIGRKFLYNFRGFDVISLLVKSYVPLAHNNKVIKLLKFKSVMNLQCF